MNHFIGGYLIGVVAGGFLEVPAEVVVFAAVLDFVVIGPICGAGAFFLLK